MRCQLTNKSRMKECLSHNIRLKEIERVVQKRIQEIVDSAFSDDENVKLLLKQTENNGCVK